PEGALASTSAGYAGGGETAGGGPRPMSTVAVVGGGRMGAGIAQVFLGIGAQVEIVESGEAAASAARERVRAGLEKARSLGKLSGVPDHLLDRLRVHPAYDGLPASADLVVEAVPEDVAVKT